MYGSNNLGDAFPLVIELREHTSPPLGLSLSAGNDSVVETIAVGSGI